MLIRQGVAIMLGPGEVDQGDMFVRCGSGVDIHVIRCEQELRIGRRQGGLGAEDFDGEAGLLLNLPEQSLLYVLIQLDMPTYREPFIVPRMIYQKYLAVVDDEYADGKIEKFVEVCHETRLYGIVLGTPHRN